mmetsp:Transcript_39359/g.122501  ORF Transcript_39359/g.122501 Transcript_39359/m.122501 type:complete len:658 (-) Transcript_39359:37-2010(-)
MELAEREREVEHLRYAEVAMQRQAVEEVRQVRLAVAESALQQEALGHAIQQAELQQQQQQQLALSSCAQPVSSPVSGRSLIDALGFSPDQSKEDKCARLHEAVHVLKDLAQQLMECSDGFADVGTALREAEARGPALCRLPHGGPAEEAQTAATSSQRPSLRSEAVQEAAASAFPGEVEGFFLDVVTAAGGSGDLPPELKRLPLTPAEPSEEDGEPRLVASVGRHHQPRFFEALVPTQSDRVLISRTAFKVSWVPDGSSVWLHPCGTNPIVVDSQVVRRGDVMPLKPGSELLFSYERKVLLCLRFGRIDAATPVAMDAAPVAAAASPAVRAAKAEGRWSIDRALNLAREPNERVCERALLLEGAASLEEAVQRLNRASVQAPSELCIVRLPEGDVMLYARDLGEEALRSLLGVGDEAPAEGREEESAQHPWRLLCVYASGLSAEDLAALPRELRGIGVPEGAIFGGPGRRLRVEAWLPDLAAQQSVARVLFRLEASGGALGITSNSCDGLLVDRKPLGIGESCSLLPGQVLGFAPQEATTREQPLLELLVQRCPPRPLDGGKPQEALPGDGCYPCSQHFGQVMPSIPEEISVVEEEISLVEEDGLPAIAESKAEAQEISLVDEDCSSADAGGKVGKPSAVSPSVGSGQCEPHLDVPA